MVKFKSSSPKILILGHQLIIASDIYIQLVNLGYPVIGIQRSMSGLLKTIESKLPDIIIIELGHPNALKSIEDAQALMACHHIPVIVISADVSNAIFERLQKINPYAIITMPFTTSSLEKGIYKTIDRINFEAN